MYNFVYLKIIYVCSVVPIWCTHSLLFFSLTTFLKCLFGGSKKEGKETPPKEMPIATTGQPTTQEPRVCSQLPATPEPIPKRSNACDDTGGHSQDRSHGGQEVVRGVRNHSQTTARIPLGLGTASPSQSPPTSSHSASSLHHQPPPMATEPPRTRSRSRSGFYQCGVNGGANGNNNSSSSNINNSSGVHNTTGAIGVSHTQQHNSGCVPFGAHGHTENLRPPGGILSPSAHRHSGPSAHRNIGAGNYIFLLYFNFKM